MFNEFRDRPRGGFGPRKMYQGNWKCADCGKAITELPFEPSEDRPLYCRECHAKRRPRTFDRR